MKTLLNKINEAVIKKPSGVVKNLSDAKLKLNYSICKSKGYEEEMKQLKAEADSRDLKLEKLSIFDYIKLINEARKPAGPEMPHHDGKNPEKVAYDINGDGWIVEAYCYADGGCPTGCDSLKDLLRNYDDSGSMAEALKHPKDYDIIDDTLIVGAYMYEDESEHAAWVWGFDGICYDRKKR